MLLLQILIIVISSYLVGKIAAKLLARLFEKTPFPENIENSIVNSSKKIIYVLGFLIIIAVIGFDITSIIVGLGALSIGISFAMKDIIKNLVSGILVQLDKLFKIGDTIQIQGFTGVVVRIRVRSTIIRIENGELVHIPNSIFSSKPLINKNLKASSIKQES